MSPMTYFAGGAAVAALAFAGLWQYERANSATLNGLLEGERQKTLILQGEITRQQETIRAHNDITSAAQERIRELQIKLDASSSQLLQATQENMRLRATEGKRALEQPFAAGNRAKRRIDGVLCAIANKSPDCHDPAGAGTGDGGAADAAGPGVTPAGGGDPGGS